MRQEENQSAFVMGSVTYFDQITDAILHLF
jgi:hypothetical protein